MLDAYLVSKILIVLGVSVVICGVGFWRALKLKFGGDASGMRSVGSPRGRPPH